MKVFDGWVWDFFEVHELTLLLLHVKMSLYLAFYANVMGFFSPFHFCFRFLIFVNKAHFKSIWYMRINVTGIVSF